MVGTDPYSLSASFSVKNISPDSGDMNEHSVVQVGLPERAAAEGLYLAVWPQHGWMRGECTASRTI